MAWITPKTDWDSDDYYNYGDLNRVENNTDYICDLINTHFITLTLTTILTRDNSSIDFYDSLNRIENNILTLKNSLHEPIEWVEPKTTWQSLDFFNYVDANRLEDNLLALYVLVNDIINYFKYCGTFYCGEDATYL